LQLEISVGWSCLDWRKWNVLNIFRHGGLEKRLFEFAGRRGVPGCGSLLVFIN